jgi:parvulin-like peptidyl-prolyl isomerase
MAGMLGIAAIAFFAGRLMPTSAVQAGPPEPNSVPPAVGNAEANKRVVAYLHGGKVPITREDLGEYLIARMNPEKVELLVNKMIIETACKERGIIVTPAEVDEIFKQDLAGINVNRKQFVENVLKQYGKTEYEWREDVLKPRLQLAKLCRLEIKVTDQEIKEAFDAEYGPKVEGRIIIWPKDEERIAFKQWEEIRGDEDKFAQAAAQQPVSSLAATGGRIKAFGHKSGTHPDLEAAAFRLQPGQITPIILTNEGHVCFKLDQQIPPNDKIKLEDMRERLSKLVYEKKVAQEIPKHFKALRDAAQPVVLLRKTETSEDLEKSAAALIQASASGPAKK